LATPPYFQRALAVLILLLGVLWEFRSTPTELRPYLARDVAAGDEVSAADLEWRRVPIGVLPEFAAPRGLFLVDLKRGAPLTASALGEANPVPAGWWSLEVPVPAGTTAGVEVRLLPSDSIDGLTALVAIPETEVGAAAAALADGSLRTLIGNH
jgi:hypothetical protein